MAAPVVSNPLLSSLQRLSVCTGAYVSQNPTILRYASGSHCSPLYSIRDPSLIVLEREQAEVAAAGVPTPLTSHLQSSVKMLVARQRRVELYAANGSIIACDDPSTSTFRVRYVIFSFLNASLTFL